MMLTQNSLCLILQAITLLCCLNLAHAGEPPSEPILRIDPGEHTAEIRSIATDDAGRWLVTASFDKTARVWDARDGHLVTTLRPPIGTGYEGQLAAVALSPDGQTVALGGNTGGNNPLSVFLFNRASGRLLRRLIGMSSTVTNLAFSPDGRSLAAATATGLFLFATADGQMVGRDRDYGDGNNYSVNFSADGRLVTTSWDGLLRLYRFDGLRLSLLAKRSAPGGKRPFSAQFSPDGKRIAVGFADTVTVNVLDASDLLFVFAPDTVGINAPLANVTWSRDGATLFAAGQAQKNYGNKWQFYIRRWSEGGVGAVQDWPVARNAIMSLAALPNGMLAFGSRDPAWGVFNGEGANQLFHAPVIVDFRAIQSGFTLSSDGVRVRYGYEYGGNAPAVFDSQKHIFLPTDTEGLIPPTLSAPGLEVTDWLNTNAPKLNGTALKLLVPNSGLKQNNEGSHTLALLPNGAGFVLGTSGFLRSFDLSGNQRWQQPAVVGVWAVNVSQDGRWVVAAYGDGTIRWHRASDGVEQLAFYPHPDKKRWVMWTPSGYYDASPGAENLIGWHINRQLNDNQVTVVDVIKDSPAMRAGLQADDIAKEINSVPVSDVSGFIGTVSKTPPNGKLQIKLLRNTQLMQLDVTPSRDNDANVPRIGAQLTDNRTVFESDFFPASRFRERFYRPDVLAKVLEKQDEAEAVRFANQESGRRTQITSIAQVLPPVVEIVSPASDSTVESGTIKVRYTVRTAADAPVTAMRIRVNGLLQSNSRALKLTSTADTHEVEVNVPEQDAEIQLFAENKYSVSTPATLRLKWAGKATSSQRNQPKPKLYVLAVGVSKYQNPEYNLSLAAKDAQDFVSTLQSQKGKLYSDVVVRLLTDDKATKDDVLDGLDWLKHEVTSRDVGIMFVAGHGMNDKLGNYYFLPYNANPEQLMRTGVSQNDIKLTFASLPGKTVFFVDTCYSGSALGTVRTSGFINDLASAENGAIVFAASTAGQLSQENASWGNGAFTKSVVEGLNGKADFRKNGLITAKGLDYYVDDRVKELTNGLQSPVSISPNGVTDFTIATVGRGAP